MTRPHGIRIGVRMVLLGIISPLMEKNPVRVLGSSAPVVLSMSRVIVLGFAVALCRELWCVGIAGWPEATLAIAVVLALPILHALEQATPTEVLEVAKTLLGRFGVGDVRRVGSLFPTEPSKFDDHRDDSTPEEVRS